MEKCRRFIIFTIIAEVGATNQKLARTSKCPIENFLMHYSD